MGYVRISAERKPIRKREEAKITGKITGYRIEIVYTSNGVYCSRCVGSLRAIEIYLLITGV
jgi:hypothetical protein